MPWPHSRRGRSLVAALLVMLAGLAGRAQPSSDLGWVRIPAGAFEMGCVPQDAECQNDERPRHPVTITTPFELMATEVTVAQYLTFARATGHRLPRQPSFRQTGRHPIVHVDWHDAVAFCEWAGGRLPTEAEWEYAARGGRSGRIYWWGDEIAARWANFGVGGAGGGSGDDRWLNTAPVASFPPNDVGLYDVSGNVWEWVADWYGDYPDGPAVDPAVTAAGLLRVARGGSWFNPPTVLRLSVRLMFDPDGQTGNVGIRCARDIPSRVADVSGVGSSPPGGVGRGGRRGMMMASGRPSGPAPRKIRRLSEDQRQRTRLAHGGI